MFDDASITDENRQDLSRFISVWICWHLEKYSTSSFFLFFLIRFIIAIDSRINAINTSRWSTIFSRSLQNLYYYIYYNKIKEPHQILIKLFSKMYFKAQNSALKLHPVFSSAIFFSPRGILCKSTIAIWQNDFNFEIMHRVEKKIILILLWNLLKV